MRHSQAIAQGPGGWDKEDMKADCGTAWPAHPQHRRPWERLADKTVAPWAWSNLAAAFADRRRDLDPWRQSGHALVQEVRSARRDEQTASRRHGQNRVALQTVCNND